MLRSLKVDGDPKLPTRMAEMLVVYEKWKHRRVLTMKEPLPPTKSEDSDCDSNDDGSAGGIFQEADL